MNKKTIIKLINWRKPLYKRLLCKHNFKGYNARGLMNGEYHYKICTKCGEVKGKPVFWEYEGMGFK